MKKKDQKLEQKQSVKEFFKTPRGQGVAFFGFYFLFFLFIAILSRTGGSTRSLNASDFERGSSKPAYAELFNHNNYEFVFTITIDQIVYQYTGKYYLNTMMFEYNNHNYYYDGINYYRQDEEWVLSENPFVYGEFLEPRQVLSLLDASSYESTTTYESGNVNYNYLLSSNTIFSMLKGIDADYMEEPNSIVVGVNQQKNVEKVSFQLDSYGRLSQICQNTFKVLLEFDQYGEIKEIESPIR